MIPPRTDLDVVRRRLRRFAERDAAAESPLYAHLAQAAADDDEVAGLLTVAEPEQARPTLLLAAAHRLVLAEPVSDLAYYYPSVGGVCGVDAATWPTFRSFVLARADRMRKLIASRHTQTNEVRRAALLYPAVAAVAREARGPIGLLEVGASAGLLLGLDRYGYRYQTVNGEQVTAGPAKARLVLNSVLEVAAGATRPTLPRKIAVAAKIGLDVHPVDVADDEQLAWLEACVWADQPERVRLLNLAAAAQSGDRPEFVLGDAVDDLVAAAERIPADLPLVVFNSHTLPYLPQARREAYVATLADLAAHRSLWWISQEAYEAGLGLVVPQGPPSPGTTTSSRGPRGVLGLVRWDRGRPIATMLARTGFHGERLEWLTA